MNHDSKMETKSRRRKKRKVKVLEIRSWVLFYWNGNVLVHTDKSHVYIKTTVLGFRRGGSRW